MQQYILGIDIGTGSTKAIAVGSGGEVLASAQQHYPTQNRQAGISEQDPELMWQQFIKCVNEIVTGLKTPPTAISFSSAMHSLIAVDNDGNALTPMMTWADTRSSAIAKALRQSAEGENIYRTTGTPIHPMSPLCKLIWLKEHNQQAFNNAHKFISIKEYIWHKLFGVFEVDYSVASGTGLFDSEQLCWYEDACKLAGISLDKLSVPVNTIYARNTINASVAQLMGVPGNTSIVIGATDGCCANLGSHVTGDGLAALTIGTSGAVRVTGSAPVYDFGAMIFNYLLDDKTFVSGGAVNNGGNAVNWLLKNFMNISNVSAADYDELFKTIEQIPAGSNGLLFLPYLHGERAPIWDAESSASFLNVRAGHTQAHFLRAGIEGICYALNDVLTHLEASSGTKIEQINVSGGFISSPIWVQLLADITGKKLVVLHQEDSSTMGAVYLAAKALFGDDCLYKSTVDSSVVIHPDKENHEVYVKGFAVYKACYEALGGIGIN